MDTTDKIIAFQQRQLNHRETLRLFSELLRTYGINKLGNEYKQYANNFIEAGYLKANGTILKEI